MIRIFNLFQFGRSACIITGDEFYFAAELSLGASPVAMGKILLIAPSFFGYIASIIHGFEKLGYEVIYFDDRPSKRTIVKASLRLCRHSLPLIRHRYLSKIRRTVKHEALSHFILIDGQSINADFLEALRKEHPETKFVLYLWDSLATFPFLSSFFPLFDRCASFDPSDCAKYSILQFVPTFFRDEYKIGTVESRDFKYLATYIGTSRPNKYQLIENVRSQLKTYSSDEIFIYHYLPSKLLYFYYKLFDKRYAKARMRDFHFSPLSNDDVISLYKQSFAIIDSPPDFQEGVTVRCYEALALGKRIITPLSTTKNLGYGSSDRILLVPFSENEFSAFAKANTLLEPEFYENYSISAFCQRLLSL